MTQSWPFDARPLTDPVDRPAVRELVRRLRAEGRTPGVSGATVVGLVVVVIVLAIMVPVFVVVLTGVVVAFAQEDFSALGVVPLVFFAVAIGVAVFATYRQFRSRGVTWWRLDRFARANGMTFVPAVPNPALPGMIFGQGDARVATDLVRGVAPRFVEFANYRYTTGSGKNRSTHTWGYVAIRLDVPLPNIVLDATANDALFGSNLPALLDKGQRLSLEGDFDRSFTLYCPRGYERDALYLFTPDIMARFVDNAAVLDVEIVDDWLFLYSPRHLSTLDPATWAWLFATVHALLDKLAQWGRWRDERLVAAASAATPFDPPQGLLRPPPGVAQPGRRLARRVPWVAWIVVGLFVLGWFAMQTGLLDALFR